jgi:hypothetical protein
VIVPSGSTIRTAGSEYLFHGNIRLSRMPHHVSEHDRVPRRFSADGDYDHIVLWVVVDVGERQQLHLVLVPDYRIEQFDRHVFTVLVSRQLVEGVLPLTAVERCGTGHRDYLSPWLGIQGVSVHPGQVKAPPGTT